MVGKPQTLSEGQKKEVTRLLWKQILAALLVVLALLGGIIGFSLWQIYDQLEQKLETLVAKQFEEPRIQEVVNNVAETKAEALLIEQINPEVQKFKTEINFQLDEIRSIVAKIEALKSQSDSNAKQVMKVLSSVRSSQQEIGTTKKAIVGLYLTLVKMQRGIIEIQYFTYLSRKYLGKNPYQERIEQKMNEVLRIAIPDSQERSKFLEELKAYQPKD